MNDTDGAQREKLFDWIWRVTTLSRHGPTAMPQLLADDVDHGHDTWWQRDSFSISQKLLLCTYGQPRVRVTDALHTCRPKIV